MKKVFIYFGCFILICFILPVVLTKIPPSVDGSAIVNENIVEGKESSEGDAKVEIQNSSTDNKTQNGEISTTHISYDYRQYNTIQLLHAETKEIESLELDEYIYGVVSAEMPAEYEKEALKAQAVVARTYLMYKIQNNGIKHENANICDSFSCCQAWISKEERLQKWEENKKELYWSKIEEAVNETAGKVITYEGNLINAFFHSNSGGITESSVNIWGEVEYPYLKSVETAGEEGYTQYSSEVVLSKEELIKKLMEKYPDQEIDSNQENWVQILDYTSSGRVRTIKFWDLEIAGTEARTILGLKSTNFSINIDGNNCVFSVKGYGHGVGMSQTGADSLAKSGKNYEEIIKHFYTGVEVVNY